MLQDAGVKSITQKMLEPKWIVPHRQTNKTYFDKIVLFCFFLLKKVRLRDIIFPELWLGVVPSIEGDLMSNRIFNCLIDMKAFSIKCAKFKLQCVQCVVIQ